MSQPDFILLHPNGRGGWHMLEFTPTELDYSPSPPLSRFAGSTRDLYTSAPSQTTLRLEGILRSSINLASKDFPHD